MKITRDGKTYDLNINELSLAHDEMRRIIWRANMDDAISRAESDGNLRYGCMTRDEFLDECVTDMEALYGNEDWDERCDEVVFDNANSDNIWVDEVWDDEEDDNE